MIVIAERKTTAERVALILPILTAGGKSRGAQAWLADQAHDHYGWKPGAATVSRYYHKPEVLRADTRDRLDALLLVLEERARVLIASQLDEIGP